MGVVCSTGLKVKIKPGPLLQPSHQKIFPNHEYITVIHFIQIILTFTGDKFYVFQIFIHLLVYFKYILSTHCYVGEAKYFSFSFSEGFGNSTLLKLLF